ncbi:MAG TPA: DnaJ domain-containing protein [Verrucomicrobiae bacterium]|nr:DnaJ domain-containing protein [Verrucomicrobiae bacterium]
MPFNESNYYVTLGLDQDCTDAHIRAAYRLLAKQHHPDVNPVSSEAKARTQALNAAYETLSDPVRRQAYDQQLAAQKKSAPRIAGSLRNSSQEIQLRLEEFLRGTTLQVRVIEPVEPNGDEVYELVVPAETAPGTRFRIARMGGGIVTVKTKARADMRFKVRGSDLRCDLRISFERAQKGGTESVRGVTGNFLRVQIPPRIRNGEVLRIAGEGLPKTRGGRGDLLVRICYRAEVRITRAARR